MINNDNGSHGDFNNNSDHDNNDNYDKSGDNDWEGKEASCVLNIAVYNIYYKMFGET